jgi:DNA-binding CsgD family transcriptional regulator
MIAAEAGVTVPARCPRRPCGRTVPAPGQLASVQAKVCKARLLTSVRFRPTVGCRVSCATSTEPWFTYLGCIAPKAGYVGGMSATGTREGARREIVRLVARGFSAGDFTKAIVRSLRRVVQFDGACLLTIDPATLLPTAEFVEHGLPPAARSRLTEIELRAPDFNKFSALAQSAEPAAGLSQATDGILDRSLRQRELRRPSGFEDELRVVLRDQTGAWGALTLMRSAERTHFSPAEVRFLASLSGPLADGLRRAAVLTTATSGRGPDDEIEASGGAGTGLLVLTSDDTVEMANNRAQRRLAELLGPGRYGPALPAVVRWVAHRARAAAEPHAERNDASAAEPGAGSETTDRAWARVRTPSGKWMIVRGSLLGDAGRVAILVEPAGSAELAPLIADAYGLTGRERRVTELVAHGYSTNDIGARLHLSAYTVQDHLKAIFAKTGSGSRGDLIARIFFEHYEPRLTSTLVSTVDDPASAVGELRRKA